MLSSSFAPKFVIALAVVALGLIAVARGQGTAPTYQFDPQGNLIQASQTLGLTASLGFDFSPRRVRPGGELLILGQNFPAGALASVSVTVSGIPATVLTVSSRVIRIVVPNAAASGEIRLSLNGGPAQLIGIAAIEGLILSPQSIPLDYGETQQFTANFVGLATEPLIWAVNGVVLGNSQFGSITATGLYAAPTNSSGRDFPFIISAQSPTTGITAYAVVRSRCRNSQPIADEVFASGTLGAQYQRECFTFSAVAGEVVYAAYIGNTSARSFSIRNAGDQPLVSVGQASTLRIPQWIVPETGSYTLQVESNGSTGQPFQVWLNKETSAPPRGTWLFPGGGTWQTADNWAGGQLPGERDPVVIRGLPGSDPVVLSASGVFACASIESDRRLNLNAGTLRCAGTIRVDSPLTIGGASLEGATILPGMGGEGLEAGFANSSRLVRCLVEASLTLSSSTRIRVDGQTELRGPVRFTGSSASLAFEGDYRFGGLIDSALATGTNYLEMQAAGTLTLAPSARLIGGSLNIGGSFFYSRPMVLVNEGQLLANRSGRGIVIDAVRFVHRGGEIGVDTGAFFTVNREYALSAPVKIQSGARWDLLGKGVIAPNVVQLTGGTLGVSTSTETLRTVQLTSGVVEFRGALDNSGQTLVLAAGVTWRMAGATISGGAIFGAPGATLEVGTTVNRLLGVDVSADLSIPSSARLQVDGATRLRGTLNFVGSSASLAFEGSHTLEGIVDARTTTGTNWLEMQTAGTLTVAATGAILGGNLNVGSSFWFNQPMILVNRGTIAASVPNRTLAINAQSFEHQTGTLSTANGVTLRVNSPYTFRSPVTVSAGERLELLATGTLLPGTLILNGGEVQLTGVVAPLLPQISYLSGAITLTGAIDNLGRTMNLNPGVTWRLNGVTLTGGTLASPSATLIQVGSSQNRLLGVDVTANLSMLSSGRLQVDTAARLRGRVDFVASSASLAFEGNFTLEGIVDNTAATGTNYLEMQTAGTLTVAPGAVIRGGRLDLGGSFWFGRAMTLINRGTIEVLGNNQTVTINAAAFEQRAGNLTIASGSNLRINGSFIFASPVTVNAGARLELRGAGTADPGTLIINGGDVDFFGNVGAFPGAVFTSGNATLTGAIDLTGQTLDLSSGVQWRLNGCTLNGGSLTSTSGATLEVSSALNRFVGVDVTIGLRFPTSARLQVAGATRLLNRLDFIGSSASLAFDGSHLFEGTLDATTSTSTNYVEMQTPGTLTIAPSAAMRGGRLDLGGSFWHGAAMTLVNQGTLESIVSARTLLINAASFEHQSGTLGISAGAQLRVNGAYQISSPLSLDANEVLELIGLGTIDPGRLALNGGELRLSATLASLASIAYGSGTVVLTGAINHAGQSADLSNAVIWRLDACVMTGGILQSTTGAVLEANNALNRLIDVDASIDVHYGSSALLRVAGATRLRGTHRFLASSASLAFEGSHTFEGTIDATASTSTNYLEMQAAGTLTIAPGATVRGGRLNIGGSFRYGLPLTLVNRGTIAASQSAVEMLINAVSFEHLAGTVIAETGGRLRINSPITVQSTLSARPTGTIELRAMLTTAPGAISVDGGILLLTSARAALGQIAYNSGEVRLAGSYDNTGQTFDVPGAVQWTLVGADWTGGSLTSTSSGIIRCDNAAANRFVGVDVACDLAFLQSGRLRVNGTSQLRGRTSFLSSSASLAFEGNFDLQGILDAQGATSTNWIEMQSAGTLRVLPSASILGGFLQIGGSVWFGAPLSLVNEGTIASLASGRSITFSGVSHTTSGTLRCVAGASLNTNAVGFLQTGGRAQIDGSLSLGSGLFEVTGGFLDGSGQIFGGVNNGGTLRPGGAGSAGRLTISGAYSQLASGRLEIELGGTTAGTLHDQLSASNVSLAGTLNLSVLPPFSPAIGNTFTIVSTSARTGSFGSVLGTALGAGRTAVVSTPANNVVVTVQ